MLSINAEISLQSCHDVDDKQVKVIWMIAHNYDYFQTGDNLVLYCFDIKWLRKTWRNEDKKCRLDF